MLSRKYLVFKSALAGISLVIVAGCTDHNASEDQAALSLAVGDSTITIPGEAIAFADEHYDIDTYWLREFQIGSSTTCCLFPFQGPLERWKNLVWSDRAVFLGFPFEHDARTQDRARFYYQSGT
ncbi:hypothetical protein HZB60_12400 [candidate division KSB1 bacterium]|nr:hypothetical protein [candidate division KSB1 bacterium]